MKEIFKIVAVTAVFAVAAYAAATTMMLLSTEDMALESDDIVRAQVIKIESKRDEAGEKFYTYTTLKALDWIKDGGARPEEFTVRQIGGTVEGMTQKVIGDAKFTEGEEALLFLKHKSIENNGGFYFLLGMSQTKFTVVNDPNYGKILKRDIRELNLVRFDEKGTAAVSPPIATVAPIKLADFIADIKRILAQNNQ
ncbi:MAG: hypothetical protein Kow0090_06410 [Myxococcota bacterium]